jgi:anti-sigma regulatory factor (Ser/Thr protein kinase)
VAASLALQLPCRAESLRELRQAVDTLESLAPPVSDAVKIVANELAANSIRHSDLAPNDSIDVSIETRSQDVRIDVRDHGTGFTTPGKPRGSGGRGLPIVQSLSRAFGISHNGMTHAWAEISLDPSTHATDG